MPKRATSFRLKEQKELPLKKHLYQIEKDREKRKNLYAGRVGRHDIGLLEARG